MKLLNGYILIKVDEGKTKTDSGLLLADSTVKLPSTGVVQELDEDEVTKVKKGDKVEFLRYAAIDGIEEGTRLAKLEHIVGVYAEEN